MIKCTCFPHNRVYKVIWESPDGTKVNQIDHVLIDSRHNSDIIDVITSGFPNIDTDRYLVKTWVIARINILYIL